MLKIAYDPAFAHPLPEGHRFPMLKYELIPEQLIYEGCITVDNLFRPEICPDEIIRWTHQADYVSRLKNQGLTPREQRLIGFPQSPELTTREWMITKGTIDCCAFALQNGVALNVAGVTHHAFTDRGEGFCLLNDMATAANYLLRKKMSSKILLIDLDVHQGNGTAKIFEQESRVFTFSMHGEHNYPFRKEKSDLDIPLKAGVSDREYLTLLAGLLDDLINSVKPDFAFFLAGVDILDTDKYGQLKISIKGCQQRDELVFSCLKKYQIPCVVAMGGGYSPDISMIVDAHCNTFRTAKAIYDY